MFEIPTLPPSVPGIRRYEILRAALRAASGRLVARRRGDLPRAIGAARDVGRDARRRTRSDLRRGLVRAGQRRLRVRCDRARLAVGHARARAGPGAAAACPTPARRGSRASTCPSSRSPAPGWRSTPNCAPTGSRTCSSPAPRCRARRRGARGPGEGIALASGYRAAAADRRPPENQGGCRVMTDLLELALLRGSLDHCVKCTICETACPVSNVTPLFPGPEVRRTAVRALPRRGRTVRRSVGRLLLGLRDLLAGLPAGRQDRRDQRAGA